MARPRKSTSKSTSFGKRSDAEKSFRDKKKRSGRGDDERPRTSRFNTNPSGKREGDSEERPNRFSKPFEKREGGTDGPFRKRPSDSFKSRTGSPSGFGKRPYQKREEGSGSERPFNKRSSGPFNSRSDSPSGFGKRPYTKREGGDEKPFRKSTSRSFDSNAGDKPRFEKRPFDRKDEGGERPFKNRESSSFDSRPERPDRFEKKPFTRREDGEKPFRKTTTRSFDSNAGDKPRFEKKPFQKRDADSTGSGSDRPSGFTRKPYTKREDGDEKPFRKTTTRSFDSNAGDKPRLEKKPFVKRKTEGDDKKSFERTEGEDKPFRKSSDFGLPYKRKPFDKERSTKPTTRTKPEPKQKSDPDTIRLNKFMANSGVGSRREADELIKMGLVTVNGEAITEMGHKVKITDEVRYEGKKLKAEKPVYILLNKPKGFITTTADPQERNTVMNLVAGAGKERIYPVGRLDRNTTGLLLLTNDGELADKLTHPSYNVKKIYKVELDKPLTKNDFIKIKEGVRLEEGRAVVDDIAVVGDDNSTIGLELHIGWNRIVRRIFESLGYEVVRLDRVAYAGLDKKDIARGQWRFLKPEEIVMLKHFK